MRIFGRTAKNVDLDPRTTLSHPTALLPYRGSLYYNASRGREQLALPNGFKSKTLGIVQTVVVENINNASLNNTDTRTHVITVSYRKYNLSINRDDDAHAALAFTWTSDDTAAGTRIIKDI